MRRTIALLAVSTALLVGPGLILWLTALDDPQAGAGQTIRNWPAGQLDDQHQFGQRALLRLDDLVGVRLWLVRPTTPSAGTIVLRLRPVAGGPDLAEGQLAVSALTQRDPSVFRFATITTDPLTADRAVPIELILETRGVDRASAVSVMAGPDRYTNGTLLQDGREIAPADLAFEPLYQASRFDRILPVTRIARARPGVFGWPPLYALLLWAALCSGGWFMASIVRAPMRK
jgi:hypothetical protein